MPVVLMRQVFADSTGSQHTAESLLVDAIFIKVFCRPRSDLRSRVRLQTRSCSAADRSPEKDREPRARTIKPFRKTARADGNAGKMFRSRLWKLGDRSREGGEKHLKRDEPQLGQDLSNDRRRESSTWCFDRSARLFLARAWRLPCARLASQLSWSCHRDRWKPEMSCFQRAGLYVTADV